MLFWCSKYICLCPYAFTLTTHYLFQCF
jgi:hypothetical protein